MSECKFTRLVVHSVGQSFLSSLGHKLLFVFLLTNAQLDLTKSKMLSNGSANVKHSEIIIRSISAMSMTWGVQVLFFFELSKITYKAFFVVVMK